MEMHSPIGSRAEGDFDWRRALELTSMMAGSSNKSRMFVMTKIRQRHRQLNSSFFDWLMPRTTPN
jgi:hypothetical protein